MPHKKVALQLIEETLKELESPKGSLLSAIQKLQRTSDIINDEDVYKRQPLPFASFWQITLLMGGWFGPAWGICMWFFTWKDTGIRCV